MILGVFERDRGRRVDEARLRKAIESMAAPESVTEVWADGPVGLACSGSGGPSCGLVRDGDLAAAVTGALYGEGEARTEITDPAAAVLAAYRNAGDELGNRIDGRFVAAAVDTTAHRLVLCRDPLGLSPCYVLSDSQRVVFADAIEPLVRYAGHARELDREAVVRFLMFNYNPGLQTLYRGVRKLRPGHRLVADEERDRESAYWSLAFEPPRTESEAELASGILERTRHAVRRRLPSEGAPAVFVSGGLDSSTVLGLIREAWDGPIHTYSYRCKSESFDESHYARLMAESVGSIHTEIEYRPQDALLIDELAATMNEPFCDVGINIATYLLGRKAAGQEKMVFTGDGGDELFGGHPIYEADKIARFVDPIPGALRRPLLSMLTWLPDSDQKKNLTVKLKRFGESALFPPELLSHRWRLYYQPDELAGILAPGWAGELDQAALYADILTVNSEADGRDGLARSLYSDYQTICDFYLRRNDLFAGFGIETRYPLFDKELVEYCARIPSALKVHGWFDTKYIFKKAIEPVLPREIVYREDKLGHSIPLKNWLRDDPRVREFVFDHVSDDSVRSRGIVRPDFVSKLANDHLSLRRNNSHRLWSLAVLEMWCRHHLDTPA